MLTRRETRTEPPNYQVRDLDAGTTRPLTAFDNPAPQLAGIRKELITYERADGVQLSGTLYLPPGYQDGERVPMLVWAYPREFVDPRLAGQVTGLRTTGFTAIRGASHLLLLTQGFAVFDGPTMPIIGAGETANDTYVEQLVASAQAAIDIVVARGVTDRDTIGIGGHSYGAFMTANLLAHSDLFQMGIARSGAYNRSLTPFGFQNERRTFWEATNIYAAMSPFFHADKVNEPILLIHGGGGQQLGHLPDTVGPHVHGPQGPRRHRTLRDPAERIPRLRRPRIGAAHRGRDAELGQPALEAGDRDNGGERAVARTSSSPPSLRRVISSMGVALCRRRPRGVLRAAQQELLDPSEAR